MNWKFWTWPGRIRALKALLETQCEQLNHYKRLNDRLEKLTTQPPPRLMLRGLKESELVTAFSAAPDAPLFTATIEEADRLFMEKADELVNGAHEMTDGHLRQCVGELRGISELREVLDRREQTARAARDTGVEGEN